MEVKTEILEQNSDFIHIRYSHQNGFVFETKQWLDKIEIISSRPIISDSDGSLKFDIQ